MAPPNDPGDGGWAAKGRGSLPHECGAGGRAAAKPEAPTTARAKGGARPLGTKDNEGGGQGRPPTVANTMAHGGTAETRATAFCTKDPVGGAGTPKAPSAKSAAPTARGRENSLEPVGLRLPPAAYANALTGRHSPQTREYPAPRANPHKDF